MAPTATLTLADFLLARIAEDEAMAAEAGGDGWEQADDRKVRWQRGDAHGWAAFADLPTAAAHIARWDPARVIAECEAKRRIVAWHRLIDGLDTGDNPVRGCGNCIASGMEPPYLIEGPCLTVRLLALPYDHPDYRPEWRP